MGVMAITIREWSGSDVDAMALIMTSHPLWQHYGVTYKGARQRLHGLRDEDESGFVAVDDAGQLRGFVLYNPKTFGFSGYIRFLGVDARSKGQGIGRALVLRVEADLLARHVNRLTLLCTAWNQSARTFYEKMGFAEVGELPNWVQPGTTEVLYAKWLA